MNPRQPRLLVSVRSVAEALSALRGGADVIDIKDPSRGPLGMASSGTITAICDAVAGRRPVSAALGELNDWQQGPALDARLSYVKIALAEAPADWRCRLQAVRQQVHPLPLIVTAYADACRCNAPSAADVLRWTIESSLVADGASSHRLLPTGPGYIAGLLIDTAVKDGCGLLHWLTQGQLRMIVSRARQANLLIALAGSLHGTSFATAVDLEPDLVAVRGAACVGNSRMQAVDAGRVEALRQSLAARSGPADPASDSPVPPTAAPGR
jgi:(5-formylfuran-3-yl)methyl phosphate synthase